MFHDNVFVDLELASPHFASRNETEVFEALWMQRFQDRSRSFAIDRFPEMDDDAIEAYQIQSIEKRRSARDVAFANLELDYCAEDGCDPRRGTESEGSYLERTSSELLEELKDASAFPDRRRRAQDILEARHAEDKLKHLVDLNARTTYELDAIAHNDDEFAIRRALAKQILDERLELAS